MNPDDIRTDDNQTNQTSSQPQQFVHETETKQVPDIVDENIDYKKRLFKKYSLKELGLMGYIGYGLIYLSLFSFMLYLTIFWLEPIIREVAITSLMFGCIIIIFAINRAKKNSTKLNLNS